MTDHFIPRVEREFVGTCRPRIDGRKKATGKAEYLDDIALGSRFPGMLYAKVLRSPHTHARIRSGFNERIELVRSILAVVILAGVAREDIIQRSATLPVLEDRSAASAYLEAITRLVASSSSTRPWSRRVWPRNWPVPRACPEILLVLGVGDGVDCPTVGSAKYRRVARITDILPARHGTAVRHIVC